MGIRKRKERVDGRKLLGDLIKSACEFPDKLTSVDIPYPKTGQISDTKSGSKRVRIGGGGISPKNKSNFDESQGDEPSTVQRLSRIFTAKKTSARKKT